MDGNVPFSILKKATGQLLNPRASVPRMLEAIHDIHFVLYPITGILKERGNFHDGDPSNLPFGRAITPAQAAECLFDFMRTAQFFRGIFKAVVEAKRRFPGERVNILYAGSGPYCLLMMPVITQFQPQDVSITLLDIHSRSIAAAQTVIQSLDIDDYIEDCVECDATTYNYPTHKRLHMVISETMKEILRKEPQAAISAHLAPQLCEGGILIPEEICIDAYFIDFKKEFERMQHGGEPKGRIFLGHVFSLTQETAAELQPLLTQSETQPVNCGSIVIPSLTDSHDEFHLFTTITVFDGIQITPYQSQLSVPVCFRTVSRLHSGDRISFEFRMDSNPRFEYSIENNVGVSI